MDGLWGQAALSALTQINCHGEGCHANLVPPPRLRLLLSLARGFCAAPAPLLVRLSPLGPPWARGLDPLVRRLQVISVFSVCLPGLSGPHRQRYWPLGQSAPLHPVTL